MDDQTQLEEDILGGVLKFLFKFTGVEKKFLEKPQTKRRLKSIASKQAELLRMYEDLEKDTGADFSEIKMKLRKGSL